MENCSRRKELPISIHYPWAGEGEGPRIRLVWNNKVQTPAHFWISVWDKMGDMCQVLRRKNAWLYSFRFFEKSFEFKKNTWKILHFKLSYTKELFFFKILKWIKFETFSSISEVQIILILVTYIILLLKQKSRIIFSHLSS